MDQQGLQQRLLKEYPPWPLLLRSSKTTPEMDLGSMLLGALLILEAERGAPQQNTGGGRGELHNKYNVDNISLLVSTERMLGVSSVYPEGVCSWTVYLPGGKFGKTNVPLASVVVVATTVPFSFTS